MSGNVKTAELVRLDPGSLIEKGLEHGAQVETMERLFALAKDVRAEQAREAWHEAVAKFQAECPELQKTKTATVVTRTGGKYQYKYAPLSSMMAAMRPALSAHGLTVTWSTRAIEGGKGTIAICRLAHERGHVEEAEFAVPVDPAARMNPAQAMGSALTYARRYSMMTVLGVAPEDDDDGANAGDAGNGRPPKMEDDRPFSPEPPPVTTNPSGVVEVPFGKNKGTPITELSDNSLAWYTNKARANLADPDYKEAWVPKEQTWLDALLAERLRREQAQGGDGSFSD
jgi:hypothetical protein